jgi:hypothetical protein
VQLTESVGNELRYKREIHLQLKQHLGLSGDTICETRCKVNFTFAFIFPLLCVTLLTFYKHSDILMFVKVLFV